MLRGERVYLTPLDPENAELAREWVNDPDTNRWMLTGHVPVTHAEERAFFSHVISSDVDHVFEIHKAEDDDFIGMCGLNAVDMRSRNAEIGIMIGDSDARGSGLGRDALLTLLRFAFHTLGLHSVRIAHIEGNEVGASLYPSLGFQPVGRSRERVFLRGEYHDLIWLDLLRDEWESTLSG